MEKIKLIVDTSADIPDEDLARWNIGMVSVPIVVDGEEFWERKSFGIKEFYGVLGRSEEIPKTARVPQADYYDAFRQAHDEGYTRVISVTINAGGSGTNASSHMAADQFMEELGEGVDFAVHTVDSQSYCLGIGWGVMEAAKMVENGAGCGEVLDYLADYFSRVEVYLATYSLEYAKKSGRISSAAAFVGDVLGLRPVISLIAGDTKIVDKVRGEKQLLQKLLAVYKANCADLTAPAVIVGGSEERYPTELQALIEKELGQKLPIYYAGASIVINSGPRIAAIVCLGKKRVQ